VFWSGSWLRRYDVDDYGRVRDKMYDILVNGLAPKGAAAGAWAPPPCPTRRRSRPRARNGARPSWSPPPG
jgi:hypothetical protein